MQFGRFFCQITGQCQYFILAHVGTKMKIIKWNLPVPNQSDFPFESFFAIGFSHHRTILSKVNDKAERFFYIRKCAEEKYSRAKTESSWFRNAFSEDICILRFVGMKMNRNWDYKRLGEICIVERGGSPRPIDSFITEDPSGINWIKIGDTDESMYITHTAQKIIPEGMKKSRYVKPGDFLLSNSMSFGRPYILKIDGCIHDGWLLLRDIKHLFDKRFLYYFLSSKPTFQKFQSMAVGGVVNNLNSEMVRSLEVPIPPIDEQSIIADHLEKVNHITNLRKNELASLDDLIKARFVELSNVWEKQTKPQPLYSYLKEITYGFTNPMPDSSEGPWKVTAKDVVDGHVNFATARKTTQEAFNSLTNKSKPIIGSVLLTKDGTLGRTAIVEDNNICVNQSVAVLNVNEKILPRFLEVLLRVPLYQEKMLKDAGGGTIKHIYITKVDKMMVTVPNTEEQRSFLSFVSQVDKSKDAVKKSLAETQLLFDSLMQEYFG